MKCSNKIYKINKYKIIVKDFEKQIKEHMKGEI